MNSEIQLAEMQQQYGKTSSNNIVQGAQTGVKSWSPRVGQPPASSHKCSRCEVFLQQVEKTIKGKPILRGCPSVTTFVTTILLFSMLIIKKQ